MPDATPSRPLKPSPASDPDRRTQGEPPPASAFEQIAADPPRMGFLAEAWAFLRENKKWWLLPIAVVLLLFGALVLLSGSAVAPFIYTLF